MPPSHVVVADADPGTRAVLSWVLRERGHVVAAVEHPDELRTVIDREDADLLVLGFTGALARQALTGIAGDARLAEVPVLAAMDRGAAPHDVALAGGVTDVIGRPINVRQFVARV